MPKEREIVQSVAPYNAEPQLASLRENREIPAGEFYVRSHGNVPDVEAADFALEVGGFVATPLRLGLADLARFPQLTVEGDRDAGDGRGKPV